MGLDSLQQGRPDAGPLNFDRWPQPGRRRIVAPGSQRVGNTRRRPNGAFVEKRMPLGLPFLSDDRCGVPSGVPSSGRRHRLPALRGADELHDGVGKALGGPCACDRQEHPRAGTDRLWKRATRSGHDRRAARLSLDRRDARRFVELGGVGHQSGAAEKPVERGLVQAPHVRGPCRLANALVHHQRERFNSPAARLVKGPVAGDFQFGVRQPRPDVRPDVQERAEASLRPGYMSDHRRPISGRKRSGDRVGPYRVARPPGDVRYFGEHPQRVPAVPVAHEQEPIKMPNPAVQHRASADAREHVLAPEDLQPGTNLALKASDEP